MNTRVHVYWSQAELAALSSFLSGHPIFSGRREALEGVEGALAKKPSKRRAQRVLLERESAESLLEVLSGDDSTDVQAARQRLDRAIRAASFRGHASIANTAAAGRSKRVRRGDVGHLP